MENEVHHRFSAAMDFLCCIRLFLAKKESIKNL